MALIKLPREVLEAIFTDVEIVDLASLRGTCGLFNKIIKGNKLLFKKIYLINLDKPPNVGDNVDGWEWEEELHRLVKLGRVMGAKEVEREKEIERKTPHIPFVEKTIESYLKTSSTAPYSKNTALANWMFSPFNPKLNREAFCCRSTLWARARRNGSQVPSKVGFEARQASAHLHCLLGVPIQTPSRSRYLQSYPFAVSVVYDLRNYTWANAWGPFLGDGRFTVDWEKMEAIMLVLAHNLRDFRNYSPSHLTPMWTRLYGASFEEATPHSFGSVSLPGAGSIFRQMPDTHEPEEGSDPEPEDPYSISGTWMRVVSFLDFRELQMYNFGSEDPGENHPRPPLETTEAFRLIVMKLKATKIEKPSEEDGQEMPVVHFSGYSRSMHTQFDPNANAEMKGTVRLTKDGEVRWTSISMYHGEERWKTEGIQVGGIGSARGVLGTWFDKDQSEEGPCGPTAFWKVANAYDENSDGEVIDEDELNDGDWVQGNDDEDDDLQEEEGEEVEVEEGGIVSGGQIIFYTIQHTEEVMEDEEDDDDG